MTSMPKSKNDVLTKYLVESEGDDALEIEPVTLQLQQHRFNTLSQLTLQAIASLEPTPINARIACGKPPQNTDSKFRPMGAAPRNLQALSCHVDNIGQSSGEVFCYCGGTRKKAQA